MDKTFDVEAYKCSKFINDVKSCETNEDIVKFVDIIVNSFDKNEISEIGSSSKLFNSDLYLNNGEYNGFIHPNIRINNATIGYGYHIYNNVYLYEFVWGIKNIDLSGNDNLLPYIMKFLDHYFGFPKSNEDMRDDILYDYALNHAEEFYKKNNIPVNEELGAVNQMCVQGDLPLSALKGTNSAQCMERSALAQNLLMLCGYNSSMMYGECKSHGVNEGHAWNAVYDKNGNITIIDYSNTVHVYKDGVFSHRIPYAGVISKEVYDNNDRIVSLPDYYYKDNKKILDGTRVYSVGKSITRTDDDIQSKK